MALEPQPTRFSDPDYTCAEGHRFRLNDVIYHSSGGRYHYFGKRRVIKINPKTIVVGPLDEDVEITAYNSNRIINSKNTINLTAIQEGREID